MGGVLGVGPLKLQYVKYAEVTFRKELRILFSSKVD